jgi:hypothetical protein
MTRSNESTAQVREHFRRKAFSFDRLYDEEHALQRLLRPGLFNRRELAVSVVREYEAPAVLDVGGGSGRVGELTLEAGASRYVRYEVVNRCPIYDFAEPQLRRLFGEFARVEIQRGPSGYLLRADRR